MTKKRYVIRLHRITRQELDFLARKEGHLTPTFVSLAIEQMCKTLNPETYELHPDSEVFQLKRGNKQKGTVKINADKQMSVYLSDQAYTLVAVVVDKLQKEVDKSIGATFVIRDMLFHWMELNDKSLHK